MDWKIFITYVIIYVLKFMLDRSRFLVFFYDTFLTKDHIKFLQIVPYIISLSLKVLMNDTYIMSLD